ncbi:hypothetical protein [Carboxylicivirga sp. M1479]|uniref:hypothetical protein n=1 Tax=Carboxylicivirga sp. M1479 TaxID=2594476 RepID=UPI001178B1F0|nr:hypothetical protein [Carboxylicivirga sp. M1479]TRX71833.1 hypothetical protein FNN09_04225 [Carboxylicivirga sp. M1479]
MKLLGKITAIIFIILFAIFLSVLLIAELAENKVTQIALERINDGVDATISVENVDFSLLRDYPNAVVELRDVNISRPGDTLAHIKRFYISVEALPLIDNEFIVNSITLEGGYTNYHIDSLGHTNFDAFLAVPEEQEQDSSTNELFLSLKQLELNKLFCSFTDDESNIASCLYIDSGLMDVYIDNDNQKASFKGELRTNNCRYPKSKLHLMEELKVQLDVEYFNKATNIKHLHIKSDGLDIQANGLVNIGDSIYTDLQISSSFFNMGELKKYIPDSLIQAYQIKKLSGIANVQASVKGVYNDSVMPHINASIRLNDGSVAMLEYPTIKHMQLAANYSNGELMNMQTSQVIIDTLSFNTGQSKVWLAANINNLDNIQYGAKAKVQLDLADIETAIPDLPAKDLQGLVDVQLSTHGKLPNTYDMHFADYFLQRTNLQITLNDLGLSMDSVIKLKGCNALLMYANNTLTVDDLGLYLPDFNLNIIDADLTSHFKGQLHDLSSLSIEIPRLELATEGSHLAGTAQFKNLTMPSYEMDIKANVKLNEWMAFAPDSLVKQMDGYMSAALQTGGTMNLDSISDNVIQTLFTNTILKTEFKNAEVAMFDENMHLSKLNGRFSLQNDSLSIEKVSGDFSGITFSSDSTSVQNIYAAYWLNQEDTIKVDAYMHLGDIDYTLIESLMTSEVEAVEPTNESIEPARYSIQAKGKVSANSFWYNNALFENLSALYNVSDSLYIADQIKFDAFKGSTNSSVKAQLMPDDVMKINFNNSTSGLDINQLLYDFDDFMEYTDEVYISHEQLSGVFSTDSLDGQIILIGDSIDLNKVKLKAKLKLEDGRLKDYPITAEMGKDYKIDGLDDLQFKTLDTKLFVTGGAVYAPLTNIKTNTFDISLFGKQDFNLDCQYHLRFYLKEILRKGKTNRIEKKQSKESKQTDEGGTKGLTSMFAIYKVENGKTVKSTLEGKDSQSRKKMRSQIYLKEAFAELEFHPLIINYNTGVTDE